MPPDQSSSPGYYEQIIESLSSGVVAADPRGIILLANPAARRHLGMDVERLPEGADIRAVPGLEAIAELFEELQRTGAPASRRELEVNGPAGIKTLGVAASPLRGTESFRGAIFLFTDLTEVRRLERAAEVNRQLAQIGELTAGIVHELRNPVSVVSGMAELLIRQLAGQSTLEKRAHAIFEEAAHLEQLIAQFLSFSKPFEIKRSRCSADELLGRVQTLCAQAALAKRISVAARGAESVPALNADPAKLAQALANLLRNAIEVSPPDSQVLLSVCCHADDVVFRVEDDGPGIRLAPGEDPFRPFFSKKEGGTGLGLAIVQRIVSAHRGAVTFGNLEPQGAFFEIHLPNTP